MKYMWLFLVNIRDLHNRTPLTVRSAHGFEKFNGRFMLITMNCVGGDHITLSNRVCCQVSIRFPPTLLWGGLAIGLTNHLGRVEGQLRNQWLGCSQGHPGECFSNFESLRHAGALEMVAYLQKGGWKGGFPASSFPVTRSHHQLRNLF